MKCDVFKEKLYDYIDGLCEEEIEMKKHIEECEECRKLFEEEKELDSLFKSELCDEEIEFKSCVNDVMSKIDKNKYAPKVDTKDDKVIELNKKRKASKTMSKYAAVAASLVLVVCASVFMRFNNGKLDDTSSYIQAKNEPIQTNNLNESSEEKRDMETASADAVSSDKRNKANDFEAEEKAEAKYSSNSEVGNNKNFEGKELAKASKSAKGSEYSINTLSLDNEFSFIKTEETVSDELMNTQWQDIEETNLSVCIDGKGEKAQEEGIGKILFKNKENGEMFSYCIQGTNQLTPKYAVGYDKNNILVIVGFAHGRVSRGGNVYLLNIETGDVKPMYVTSTPREEVTKVVKDKEGLKLELIVFDKDFNDYVEYKGIIRENNGEFENIIEIFDVDNGNLIRKVEFE